MRLMRMLGVPLCGLAIAGCTGGTGSGPASTVTVTATADSQIASSPTTGSAPGATSEKATQPSVAPAANSDDVAFTATTAGGLANPVSTALNSPTVAVYRDGRVLTMNGGGGQSLVPARYDEARIDPAAVATFVSDAVAGEVFKSGTDFGTPKVTDQETTVVMVNGPNGPNGKIEASAYALDMRFDDGLTSGQREARVQLRALISRAGALAAAAPTTAYSPDRVMLYELEPGPAGAPATAPWPGPPLSEFLQPSGQRGSIACGEMVADPAERVYQAALENPAARWLVDGKTRVVAVNPLPLAGSCP